MARRTFPRRHPGLIRSLQCFEAVARHRSVSAAAVELGVSQSAVSHQLRELSGLVGEQLIARAGRGIALTTAGEDLARRLSVAFESLHDSIDSVVGGNRRTLRLAVCSSFGPGWLIPRLPRFIEAWPAIDLQLRLYAGDPELSGEVADAIISAVSVKPGFTAIQILNEVLVSVEAPGLHDERRKLITTETDPAMLGADWSRYCAMTGLDLETLRGGAWLQTTHYMLALEMARAGLGVALVPDFIAAREIERGALVHFDRTRMGSGRTYRLCFKHMRSNEPDMLNLAQWFRSEAAATVVSLPAKRRRTGGSS